MSETDTWVTVQEAAAYARVSTNTIRRLITSNTLIAKRFGPRLLRIRRDSLEQAMASR